MAGRQDLPMGREQYLQERAYAVEDMLRQMQSVTLDMTPREHGRSYGMHRGGHSRGVSPQMMSSKSNDKELQTSNSVSCEGNDKELKASNTVSSKKDDKILEPSILEMNEMETESLQDYCVYEANEISEILQMMSTGSDGQELKPSSQDVKEMEPKGLQDCYRDKDNFEIVEMNSEIAVKKKEPEGLEVQNKVEPRCPEDHHRYETFTVEEMMKQMENAATFDWEDDVNDPFEKAVARSGEANREPDAQKITTMRPLSITARRYDP